MAELRKVRKRLSPEAQRLQREKQRKIIRAMNLHFRCGLDHNVIMRALHEETEELKTWAAWRLRWKRSLQYIRNLERERRERMEKQSWQTNVLTQTFASAS